MRLSSDALVRGGFAQCDLRNPPGLANNALGGTTTNKMMLQFTDGY